MRRSKSSLILLLITICMPSHAEEPKLRNLLRFTDAPHQNEFLLESDCNVTSDMTHSELRLINKCRNDLKEQNYNLRLNYIKDYLKFLIYGTKEGKIYLEDKIDAYEELYPLIMDRENAYKKFASAECAVSYYCGGDCGSGDIDSQSGCLFEKLNDRSKVLDEYIQADNDSYKIESIYLVTDKYEIKLSSQCNSGLFLCNDVKYHGKSKSSGNSLTLNGKSYFGKREGSLSAHQLGMYFKNGEIEYFVDFSGTLEVINTKTNRVIVKDTGVWRRNP